MNYNIEVTNINGIDQPIVWITGTRCKWECDRKSKVCGKPSCWENPSLCLGDVDSCTKRDSDGSCLKISDLGEKNTDEKTFSFTNMDLEKYIYKYFENSKTGSSITESGLVSFEPPQFFSWMCDSIETQGDHHVICRSQAIPSLAGPSHNLLKTIAG